ncbi:MAG: hypothetical protein KIS87_00645 [Phycisphaeraceae bacterium]|nr:hypothetical protein [Phycisphaeraceae bacterium]
MDLIEHDPLDIPRTPDDLERSLRVLAGVSVPRRALTPGHSAPFDYLAHAFFEGAPSLGEPPVAPPDAVVWANRGGGKTYLGALATMLDLVHKPGIEVRILGGSLEQSRRMHTHLRALFAREPLAGLVEGRITERRLALTNGSVVELLAQSQTSVRGTRVQKLRCDEVELFDPEVWEAAQLVTRSRRIALANSETLLVRGTIDCLSTMHLPHGLMHAIVEECRAGRRQLFRWGIADTLTRCGPEHVCRNDDADCALFPECQGRAKAWAEGECAGHVEIADAMAMKARVSAAAWEAEMLCLRPSRTHAVLPEFDPRLHVVHDDPPDSPAHIWIAGMDFGYRSPTVVLWACVDPAGALSVVAERVESGLILGEHVRAILEAPWPPGGHARLAWIGADPAGRQMNDQTGVSAVQAMSRASLRVRTRAMGVQEGLALLRARLRPAAAGLAPRLFIHARCARLVESLERYHYNPDKPESLEPVKDGHDHAVDALRYMVQNLDASHECTSAKYV